MSGRTIRHRETGETERQRKGVSVYDKLADARERRAEVLAASRPANETTPVKSRKAPAVPEPAKPETTAKSDPDTVKHNGNRGPRQLIWALSLLLIGLVVTALVAARTDTSLPVPAFSLQLGGLLTPEDHSNLSLPLPQAFPFRPISLATAPLLPRTGPDDPPASSPAAPAPRGPSVTDSVQPPQPPQTGPAGILTLTNEIRPQRRPSSGSLNFAVN